MFCFLHKAFVVPLVIESRGPLGFWCPFMGKVLGFRIKLISCVIWLLLEILCFFLYFFYFFFKWRILKKTMHFGWLGFGLLWNTSHCFSQFSLSGLGIECRLFFWIPYSLRNILVKFQIVYQSDEPFGNRFNRWLGGSPVL